MVDYIIRSANSLKLLRYTNLTPFCQTYIVLFHVIYLQNTKPTYIVAKKTVKKKIKQRPKQKQQASCKWAKEKSEEFLNKISIDKINQPNTYLESLDETMVNSDIINQIVENVMGIFIDAAESTFNHRPKHNNES